MSAYNVRLYDYKYSQQVRIYSRTINKETETEKEIKADIRNNRKKEVTEKDEDRERTQEEIEHSMEVSVNRTKQKIYEIARSNDWEWFITLTFDRDKIDSSNYDSLVNTVRKWFNHVKERKAPNMKYLIVPELHLDGEHYHFHGLLADCDGLTFVDSGIKQKKKKVFNIKDFKFGFTTATRVEDTKRVSSYISKYITKDLEKHIKGKRRFLYSKNCEKAKVYEYAMTDDEKKALLDMVSNEITFAKSQTVTVAGQKINYFELRK